jgi:di/tricarboxylate transporter
LRVLLPTMVISAVLINSTAVVSVVIPVIAAWCRHAGLAPGHLYMPLSFASILGGTVTLAGSPANLAVAGKFRTKFPDAQPLQMFGLTPYGVPVALAGAAYIILFGPRLLPGNTKRIAATKVGGGGDRDRRRRDRADSDSSRNSAFLVGLKVLSGSPAIDKTVQGAGMRGLPGIYLTSVQRGESVVHAVAPDFVIARGDILVFAGDLADITELAERFSLRVVADAYEDDLPPILGTPRGVARRVSSPLAPPSSPIGMDDAFPALVDSKNVRHIAR